MNDQAIQLGLGEIFTNTQNSRWRLTLDAIAVAGNPGSLQILSAVGPQTSVKGVSALLKMPESSYISFSYRTPVDNSEKTCARYHKFTLHKHKLGFDHWHLLAIAQNDSLLTSYSQLALWELLRGSKFTTPLIQAWIPWVAKELKNRKKLRPINCWRCEAAMLDLDTPALDEVVSYGIRVGALKFEPQEAA